MSMPRHIEARRYYRLARQRLREGELILKRLELSKAAVYLSGYAVECILKALLIHRTPPKRRAAVVRSLRGGSGHDLLKLRGRLAGEAAMTFPTTTSRQLTLVSDWSVDLRYEPGEGDRDAAERFIDATASIVAWADRSI